jgi:hypothetical protein
VENQKLGGRQALGGKYEIESSQHLAFVPQCLSTPLSAWAIFPPWCKEAPMEGYVSERRNSPRHLLKTKLRVRAWKSGWSERRAESETHLGKRSLFRHRGTPGYRLGGRGSSENAGGDQRQTDNRVAMHRSRGASRA